MDLLWKKEPKGKSYVDIFSCINEDPVEKKLQNLKVATAVEFNKKNNQLSTKYRLGGNKQFNDKKWRMAMKCYNLSLRFAEIGTENVGLAYANRAQCFLKLGMFDKCITDIEMAMAANYPKQKMSKLEERRAYCLQQIEKEEPNRKVAPKLDFPADNGFHPGMANVLEMKHNEKFGRCFVAKSDIDVGKVIMVDEAFVTSTVFDVGENICDTCFKHMDNFVACQKCTFGLFCDEICSNDDLHTLRCGRSSKDDDGLVEFAIRSMGRALEIFPNADDMMRFVANVVQDPKRSKSVPTSIVDMESKYRMFLTLNLWLGTMSAENLIAMGRTVFGIVMQHPSYKAIYSSQEKSRFLMHLCVYHVCIVLCNSFQSTTGGIFLLKNHFNHSCSPNVLTSTYENKAVGITSRRVKKGEQLFISYGGQYFFGSRAERQKGLNEDFGFKCGCEKCVNKNWPVSSNVIKSDKEFQPLAKELDMDKIDFTDGPKCAALKQKCLDILIKYGEHPWTKEKDLLASFYQHLSVETMN